jgi:Probable Zinc-ribbon domain/SAP domain
MRILKELKPELIDELATELNTDIDPEKANTLTRVWWRCKDAECDHHVWEARIHDRAVKNSGCPFCNGKKVCSCNCLATIHPEIAAQWHPTKNGSHRPADYSHASGKNAWWLCPNSKCHHVHEWRTSIGSRVRGTKCPWCCETGRKKKVCECGGLAQKFPEIAKEWMTNMNKKDASTILAGSNEVVWWKCSHCSHQYERSVNDRTRTDIPSICPQCKDAPEQKDGKYFLDHIGKYNITQLRTILREHNIPGRTMRKKSELYRMVADLYRDLNAKQNANDEKNADEKKAENIDEKKVENVGYHPDVSIPSMEKCKEILRDLKKCKLSECQEIAHKYGLNSDGTKTVLQKRIEEYLEGIYDDRKTPDISPKVEVIVNIDDSEPEIIQRDTLIAALSWNSNAKQLLELNKMLTVKEFVHELKLPVDQFQIEEYWDGWNDPSKYIIVNRHMLTWMGYQGPLKKQRENFLESAKLILKSENGVKFFGPPGGAELIGAVDEGRFSKIIAIGYFDLKKFSMTLHTGRGASIRESYVKQEMLFKLYTKYQYEFQQKEIAHQNEEQKVTIGKLQKTVARYEKSHKYVSFGSDAPAYYIFSYGRRCADGCPMRNFRKHGIAITSETNMGPLDERLESHRTTFKWLLLEFAVYGPPDCIKILEKNMQIRYGENLNPNSSEVFDGIPLDVLKSSSLQFLELLCPGKYTILPQDQVDKYNHDVDGILKDISNDDTKSNSSQ